MSDGPPHGAVLPHARERQLQRENTELRAAKEAADAELRRLCVLIENTSDIITILSAGGSIRYESPSVERVLGYKPEELLGKNVMEFVHPEDRSRARTALACAFRYAGRGQTIEVRFCHRDGSWRVLEVLGRHPAAASGINGVVLNARDVTERKRIEEAARQHEAELSYLQRLGTVGEMATGIAHELNQPLAAITNYARGCARRITSGIGEAEQIVPALEEIATQAMRAGAIIRQLRNFVRRGELRREDVDINEVVREAARFLAGEAGGRAVPIRLDLATAFPPICADATQIEQVILNLARNGLEAQDGTDRDARALVVRTARGEHGEIEIAVVDRGEGLRPEIADKIFDPFFSTKAGALGMGLSISRSIVEAHGGRLWFTPNPEGGSIFHVSLPLQLREQGEGAVRSSRGGGSSG